MFSKSTVKYIQSLQHKKFRDQHQAFIAEGPKVVGELLDGHFFNCQAIFAVEEWIAGLPAGLQNRYAGQIHAIRDFELEKISGLTTPHQVLGVFEKKSPNLQPVIGNKLTMVLDDIQDPGNLGTLVRIADWFGIENIICSLHTADMYNLKVVQGTMASLGRVNILYTDIITWLNGQTAIPIYAAALEGKNLSAVGRIREGIVVIGNESKGISEPILALAREKITIPRTGFAESLNAAVAAGIILYQFREGGSAT